LGNFFDATRLDPAFTKLLTRPDPTQPDRRFDPTRVNNSVLACDTATVVWKCIIMHRAVEKLESFL